MYVRVTAFKSDPGKLDQGTAFLRERVIPTLSQAPGFLGATELIDRAQGTGAAGTLWESLEAMNRADQAGVQARIETAESVGMEIVDVDRFEIVLMNRIEGAPLPSYTRLITAYGDPARAEAGMAIVREQVLPLLKAQPGYVSFVAGINRMTGRGFTSSSWRTPEQREASDAAVAELRQTVAQAGGLYGVQASLVETVVVDLKVGAPA